MRLFATDGSLLRRDTGQKTVNNTNVVSEPINIISVVSNNTSVSIIDHTITQQPLVPTLVALKKSPNIINEASWTTFQKMNVTLSVTGGQVLDIWFNENCPAELNKIKESFFKAYSSLNNQLGIVLFLKKTEQLLDASMKQAMMQKIFNTIVGPLYHELLLTITADIEKTDNFKPLNDSLSILKPLTSYHAVLLLKCIWLMVVVPYIAHETKYYAAKNITRSRLDISPIVENMIKFLSGYPDKVVLVDFMIDQRTLEKDTNAPNFYTLLSSRLTLSGLSRFEEYILPKLIAWGVHAYAQKTIILDAFFNQAIIPFLNIRNEAEGKRFFHFCLNADALELSDNMVFMLTDLMTKIPELEPYLTHAVKKALVDKDKKSTLVSIFKDSRISLFFYNCFALVDKKTIIGDIVKSAIKNKAYVKIAQLWKNLFEQTTFNGEAFTSEQITLADFFLETALLQPAEYRVTPAQMQNPEGRERKKAGEDFYCYDSQYKYVRYHYHNNEINYYRTWQQ